MKKVLFILALFYAISVHSQIGVTGGLNFSSLRSDADNSNYKIGFHIGGFYDIRLSGNLYLQPQLLLSHNPTSVTYDLVKITSNGYYLTTPVLFSYKFPVRGKNKFGFDLGFYTSLGLFGDEKNSLTKDGVTENRSNPLFDDYWERFEIGLIGGIRYELDKVIFSGHYKHGLQTMNSLGDKVSLFMLSVGYRFR